jgi:tRNA-(ms[2]io[6]A)-hydroxylase
MRESPGRPRAVHCAAVLNLASTTTQQWADRAVAHIDDVLLDHAHCEKKAAGAALRMLFRYPEHGFLQEPISKLAREELGHFERMLRVLEARGVAYVRQKPSAYGGKLHNLLRTSEPDRLLDLLIVSALIEARSCERFRLLSETLEDAELAALYADLLASEARHHQLYIELAEQIESPSQVRVRLLELARDEARIVEAPSSRVRLHSC